MNHFPKRLCESLLDFNLRKLVTGELFLLAKTISSNMSLPLSSDMNTVTLKTYERRYIDLVLDALAPYTYIEEKARTTLYTWVTELLAYRYAVATGSDKPHFSGDTNMLVDDFTSILRWVNNDALLSINDVIHTANWTYHVFDQLCFEVRKEYTSEMANKS